MKQEIINNILNSEPKKLYGKVIKPIGLNRWLIRDSSGRTVEADSDILWAVGAGVTVRSGLITGKASTIFKKKVFVV